MTLPSRIREACGVERFDVVHTKEQIEACYHLMRATMPEPHVLQIIGSIYQAAQRELTTKTT